MIEFTLYGRPISKKNSRQIFVLRGRMMNLPSKAYAKYAKEAAKQISYMGLVRKYPEVVFPIPHQLKATFLIYLKGSLDIDLSNAIQGVEDIMTENGIIVDDKLIMSLGDSEKIPKQKDWRVDVRLEVIESGNV